MFPLPDFLDEMDDHDQQMLLAHAAMYEDATRACYTAHCDHFYKGSQEPAKRQEGFAHALVCALGVSAENLTSASTHRHLFGAEDDKRADWFAGYSQGTRSGETVAAYQAIRAAYQALRSYDMLDKGSESDHWQRVLPKYRAMYYDDPSRA